MRNFFTQSVPAYFEVIRWLIEDSLLRFKKRSLVIVLGGFAGLAFQAFAIGQVLYYAKLLDKGGEFSFGGISLYPRESLILLVGVASGILLSLAISSYLVFKVKSKALTLSLIYERFLIKKAFEAWARGCAVDNDMACIRYPEAVFSRIINSDCKLCSRAFLKLLHLIEPLCVLLFSVSALLFLDWATTLVLLPVAVIGGWCLVKVNVESAKAYQTYEQISPFASAEKRSAWRYYLGISGKYSSITRIVDKFLHEGKTHDQIEAYRRYMISSDLAVCINSIILGAGFFCILIFIGFQLVESGGEWHRLTAYLLGLRFSVSSLKTVSSILLAINRFFPQIQRVSIFLERAGGQKFSVLKEKGNLPQISFEDGELEGQNRIAVMVPFELDSNSLDWILAKLLSFAPEDVRIFSDKLAYFSNVFEPVGGESFQSTFGLHEEVTPQHIENVLRDVGYWEKHEDDFGKMVQMDFSEPIPQNDWSQLHKRTLVVAFLINSIVVPVDLVILDSLALNHLPAKGRPLLDMLSEKTQVVIVYGTQAKVYCASGEEIAILYDHLGGAELVSAKWCSEHTDLIRTRIENSKAMLMQHSANSGALVDEISSLCDVV